VPEIERVVWEVDGYVVVEKLETAGEVVTEPAEPAARETPPLDPDAGGPARTGELLSGIGAREHAP